MRLVKLKQKLQEEHYKKVLDPRKHGKPLEPLFARIGRNARKKHKLSPF